MITWILVANRAEARIFTQLKNNSQIEFLKKLENPKGRLRDQDIDADRPGTFSQGGGFGTREREQSPTERVAEIFAKEITEQLDLEKSRNSFENLVVIAEPSFLGLLRSSMSKDLSRHVTKEIAKDLGAASTPEVQERMANVEM